MVSPNHFPVTRPATLMIKSRDFNYLGKWWFRISDGETRYELRQDILIVISNEMNLTQSDELNTVVYRIE